MGYSTGEAIQENAEAAYWEEVQRLSDETINELLRGQAVSLLDFESGQELARHLKKSLVAKSIAAAESDAKAARELAKETHKLNVRTTQATVVIAIASASLIYQVYIGLWWLRHTGGTTDITWREYC